MKKIKKLLYLLQLEEYQAGRFKDWLKKYSIEKLEEKKGELRWTLRIVLIFIFCLPFLFLGFTKAVAIANRLAGPIFRFFEEVIVLLARLKLMRYSKLIKIIITGSYGKTTFKEMLAWALASKYSVLKTPGNFNTRIGIARTIIRQLNKNHQILIVEAGAYQQGDIRQICQLVRPQYGMITMIGWMHFERFKTVANIRQTKFELANFIEDISNFYYPTKNHQFIDFQKTISTIGQKLGIKEKAVKTRLAQFPAVAHRLTAKNINPNLTVLDDTYNSNPFGFQRAVNLLKQYLQYQKVIVTPGMIELGEKQYELNLEAAKKAAKIVDIFAIVGETNRKALAKGAKTAKKVILLSKDEEYGQKISPLLKPPTVVLLENELPDHYF